MAYASLAHVLAYNPQRATYNNSTRPTGSQAQQLLDASEAEIVTALSRAGYADPIPSTATAAWKTVQNAVVVCAASKIEEAAPSSDRREQYRRMCNSAKEMLELGDLPGVEVEADNLPRGPVASPAFFTREMDL